MYGSIRESTILKLINNVSSIKTIHILKTRSIRVTYRPLRKVAERAQEGDDDGGTYITYDLLRGAPSWPRSTQL